MRPITTEQIFYFDPLQRVPNKAVNRTEVFYSSKVSREPAELFGDVVSSAVGSQDGLAQKVDWTVLWKNRAPLGALLVEVSYLSHPTASEFLAHTQNRDAIALGLQRAVDNLLEAETLRRATRQTAGVAAKPGDMFR